MTKCGKNVSIAFNDILTREDLESIYDSSEWTSVFGSLSVTPSEIIGNSIVGDTLTTDYTYSDKIDLLDVKITWERSLDQVTWTQIPGATGKTYQLQDAEFNKKKAENENELP